MNFKIVTAAIVLQDNKVLLTRRAPGQSLEGYWEFPGGKVEEGESLQECLKREIFEELGVQAEVEQDEFCVVKHQYDHGEILLVGILTYLKSHNFQLTVHDQYDWVPVDDLLSFKLAPADIPIAQKLLG
jgi:8-oxo-dGTP diphosphatase